MVVLFEPENFYQSFKKEAISTRDTLWKFNFFCPWKVWPKPKRKGSNRLPLPPFFQGRTVKLRGVYMVSPPSAFSVEALGCLSSFSGAYNDSEICVGGHWGKAAVFFLSDPATCCQSGIIRLQVNACRHGLVPMGGMTYVLGTSTLFNEQTTKLQSMVQKSGYKQLRLVFEIPLFTMGFIHPTCGWEWDFWTINSMNGTSWSFIKHHGEVSILAMAPWWISSSYGLASSWSWLGFFGSLGVSWMSWVWWFRISTMELGLIIAGF